MAVENITLNLIPTGDTPSIHVAQFDVDRPFTVTLKEGEDDFTPTGYDIELQVRKVDNNIVTTVPTQTSGNVVTFNTTEQMTACSGTNIAELQLTKDSQTFATLHFYLVVQRDVLAGGLTSQSEIYDLEEQIAAIVPEVIGDDYYNKEEVDEKIAEIPTFDPTNYYDKSDVNTLLNDKADISDLPDMTNYYNKSDVNALLNDKADISDLPDMTNYYNKSDVNALLNDKADVSDLPDMTDYYTKSEVDTKITSLYQIKTASGSIVHITDGGNEIPVKSLSSEIVAVESGSGEKSPANPYTISGFDIGVITRCGKNLFSGAVVGSDIDQNGNIISRSSAYWRSNKIPIGSNKKITFSVFSNPNYATGSFNYRAFDSSGLLVAEETLFTGIGTTPTNKTVTLSDNVTYLYIRGYQSGGASGITNSQIQFEFGDTASEFEQYNSNTYTFTFGQTVYGGHFDNKGNLVVTHGFYTFDGTETPIAYGSGYRYVVLSGKEAKSYGQADTPNLICNEYNAITRQQIQNGTTGISITGDTILLSTNTPSGVQVAYELATPITLSITSQDIPTLLGENNIFSNCGDVEVKYFTEKSDGIAELIKAFI